MNHIQIIGSSGADAKIEYLPGEKAMAICKLSVATGEFNKKTNGWDSTWHGVVLFGKLAESLGRRVKKGTKLFVEGKLQKREWQGKDGSKKNSVDIIARAAYIIEKEPQVENPYSQGQSQSPGMQGSFSEEDVPF